jgi:hypothetical protein
VIETSPLANDIVASLREHSVTVLGRAPALAAAARQPPRRACQTVASSPAERGGHLSSGGGAALEGGTARRGAVSAVWPDRKPSGARSPPTAVDEGRTRWACPCQERGIHVLRDDGRADPGEIGELVHIGPTSPRVTGTTRRPPRAFSGPTPGTRSVRRAVSGPFSPGTWCGATRTAFYTFRRAATG